jgi:hypothetical protein
VHSPSNGEIPALSAGIYHWQTGNFDLFRVNPPLVRCLAALPVLAMQPKTDWSKHYDFLTGRDEFPIGIDFVYLNGERSFLFFKVARLACLPFSLLGAFVCFRWAKELYGDISGLIALSLWCLSPIILGHAATIGSDVPSAACGIFACYQFWHWMQKTTWFQAVFTGLALGLAELTKTTWIILLSLLPILYLLWFVHVKNKRAWRQLFVILLLGIFCINLGYGFERFGTSLGDFRFISRILGGKYSEDGQIKVGGNRFKNTLIEQIPVLLPANYVLGIDIQKSDFEFKNDNYLNGTWQSGGWWYYYLFALLVREPIGTLFLFFLSIFTTAYKEQFKNWKDEIVLLLPAICVFTLVSAQIGMNHHYRYIIPIFPFLFIWIGKVAQYHLKTTLLSLLLIIISSFVVYPHCLSYFNELIGGPKNGPKYLLGSNVDWGQDILLLKKWHDKHPKTTPFFLKSTSYFDPAVAKIEYQIINSTYPQPGWYALSVNSIYSREKQYRYFLNFEPVAMTGYSMYIYHITLEGANRVRREMGLPEIEATTSEQNKTNETLPTSKSANCY